MIISISTFVVIIIMTTNMIMVRMILIMLRTYKSE